MMGHLFGVPFHRQLQRRILLAALARLSVTDESALSLAYWRVDSGPRAQLTDAGAAACSSGLATVGSERSSVGLQQSAATVRGAPTPRAFRGCPDVDASAPLPASSRVAPPISAPMK